MHGYSRLGTARVNGSPPSSPRFRHGRNKVSSGFGRGSKQRNVDKLVFVIISAVFRKRGVLLFAPLLYISGMLLYMGSVNFDVSFKNAVVVVHKRPPPGSVYRSPQVFEKLWPFMEAESNVTDNAVRVLFLSLLWRNASSFSFLFFLCKYGMHLPFLDTWCALWLHIVIFWELNV